jgi:hypothetical protein
MESLHSSRSLRMYCLDCQSHHTSLKHKRFSETDTRVQLLNPLMIKVHFNDI